MNTPNFVTVLSGVALATSGMVFGLCLPSSAAQLWNWSYSGGGSIGGNGTFTTDDGPSPYIITDITGTSEGNTITSLMPVGTDFGGPSYTDNELLAYVPQLTEGGIGYESVTSSGFSIFNIYFDTKSADYVLFWIRFSPAGEFRFPVNFTATLAQEPSTTPEPSSLLSFIALGGLVRLWCCSRS